MLLFFDGVAFLAPPEVRDQVLSEEPETMWPLFDAGLVKVLDPYEMITESTAQSIARFLNEVIENQDHPFRQLDPLERALENSGGLIYRTRSGGWNVPASTQTFAATLWPMLQAQGLVTKPGSDGSFRARWTFWRAYEALLAYTLRQQGQAIGLDLYPATDDLGMVQSFSSILGLEGQPSAGQVVVFDLEEVSVDVSQVPISEVLEFRDRYGSEFRSYRRNLRAFVDDIASVDDQSRQVRYQDRRSELADAADDLARLSRKAWKRPAAAITLGVAGAAWTTATQADWLGGALALLSALAGISAPSRPDSAYTYLFQVRDGVF